MQGERPSRGARRTWYVRRNATEGSQRSRWAFFSSLLHTEIDAGV
jgi:hypothetical protein